MEQTILKYINELKIMLSQPENSDYSHRIAVCIAHLRQCLGAEREFKRVVRFNETDAALLRYNKRVCKQLNIPMFKMVA